MWYLLALEAQKLLHIALYRPDFSLVSLSTGIGAFFRRWPEFANAVEDEVPAGLTGFVRNQAALYRRSSEDGVAALYLPTLLVLVAELVGPGERLVAATFRPFAVRDPVRVAANRFKLTDREGQVLTLMLRGLSATEIAQHLELSELTIGDYFKRLRVKTGARTQSGMIAMLLGWTARSSENIDAEHAG